MSQSEKLIFGPRGCGKTYTLINIVKQELANGTPPDRIGFVCSQKNQYQRQYLGWVRTRIRGKTSSLV